MAMDFLVLFACVGSGLGFGVLAAAVMLKQYIYVCRPNEILIFSGRERALPDGTRVGYRVVHGGTSFRVPLLEKVDRMDLTTIPIDVQIHNAYSKGGIPLSLHAIANVKVSSKPEIMGNAVERFLGGDPAQLQRVAKESLEGHLRGVLARMTPEEVNEDRLKFAEELVHEADEDFDKLGLELDTLKVQSVSDEVSYLDSIGRERLANVLAEAEIAESTAKADAEVEQAQAAREGQVAGQQADMVIKQRENELRSVKAELEGRAKAEEEKAEQAGFTARARAEQQFQQIRARLEHLRLSAEIVLPAEAERKASEMRARSDAASIAADGQAMAEVLRMLTETWIKAGPDARDIFLLQQLESVLSTVTDRVSKVQIGQVHLIDGGNGQALPAHIAAMPATVASVLREFRQTTGVDVTGILTGVKPPPHEITQKEVR
jgi:flotillin